MCDAKYHLYWWATEPYLEKVEEGQSFEEPHSRFGLQGMMFDTANELFKVWIEYFNEYRN